MRNFLRLWLRMPYTLFLFILLSLPPMKEAFSKGTDGPSPAIEMQKAHYIAPNLKGQKTLQQAIAHQGDNKSFHLFSHGQPGELLIEGTWKNPIQIKNWIADHQIPLKYKQLNIYGCNFAKGEKGRAAVAYLETALGVSVAASDDLTGIDGDWELEVGNAQNTIVLKDYNNNLQTALKWSAYLSDEYQLYPSAMHLDEVNDRLYVAGTVRNPSFTNTLPYTYKDGGDIGVLCLSTDGTTVHWAAHWGGSGADTPFAISTNTAGDLFIAGKTASADFPTAGTVSPYDASINSTSGTTFITRLNASGTTLEYSSYIGARTYSLSESMVVEGDVVYYGIGVREDFPVTAGAFQTTRTNSEGVVFALNTAQGGTAGLEWATYIGGTNWEGVTTLRKSPDGELVIAGSAYVFGDGSDNFPVTANAIQTPSSLIGKANNTEGQFVAKFTTDGALTYSTLLMPVIGASGQYGNGTVSMDVDAEGNIYTIAYYDVDGGSYETAPNNQLTVLDNSNNTINVISKTPADLSPALEYMTIFSSNSTYETPHLKVDNKNRVHLVMPIDFAGQKGHFETAGNLPPINVTSNAQSFAYGILSASGTSVEYMTNLSWGSTADNYLREIVVAADGTAYLGQNLFRTDDFPSTPTYYDAAAGTQKTVFNSTVTSSHISSNPNFGGLMVFHDPLPNDNTITDFAGGNNTFCIDGLIYQDPNEGPINGSTVTYQSGDGSSALHNLPDLYVPADGTSMAHPTPESPASKYQWEISYDGTTWETIPGADLSVLKPEPEPAAATVRYRRLLIASCDTIISNIATATIVGTFGLDVSLANEPVYYCPGTAKSLGITITGATGNIDWQWYNGFAPLASEISPASGTNTAQGAFTADIPTSATEGGSYRLVVTDANGCKKEAFVSIEPLTTPAFQGEMAVLCPGTTPSITLGSATNPDFDYSWTGPSGFTSSVANPTVTATGTYTLQVKLTSDASFCAGGATSVTIAAPTSHDAALTTIADSEFCQSDSPAPIGLGGAPPSGYVFQWTPGVNLDDAQAYSPNFDSNSLPFDISPISTIEYAFTALRLSDGCIFETTTTVTDMARPLAQAGIDLPAASCNTPATQVFGAAETDGNYWEWRAVATTYPGDVAALSSHVDFLMDGAATNLGTNKFLTAQFPYHTACYTIDYEIKAAYEPFPTNCFGRDTVRLFYCPGCPGGDMGNWCTDLTANNMGTDGACAGTDAIIGGTAIGGLTYTWTTYSVDGVVQPANTDPQGLFEINVDGTKGTAFVGGAAHPAEAIADFDDVSWGWPGASVVIYRLTTNGNLGAGDIDCHRDIQVFSAADATPVISVLDQSFCTVEAPAIRLGSSGTNVPYTLSGIDYTQAPNSAFNWEWTVLSGTTGSVSSGGTSPFPTIEPTDPTYYEVAVIDPVTGCRTKDTLFANVVPVITNAGEDIDLVCDATLVQLGSGAQANHTYSWSPVTGLNSPIGTLNSMVADPFLIVAGDETYTVTVTETTTGCQATDEISVTTTNSAPPAPGADGPYNACADAVFSIGPFSYSTDFVTFSWSAQGGTADLAWLNATDVLSPIVTLPSSFTGPATFRLTVTQGNCGSSFQDYVINDNAPAPNLGANVSYDCSAATIELSNGSNFSYDYAWTPNENLYTNSAGTSVYNGAFSSSRYRIYASPGTTTTYTLTMRDRETGCEGTDDITVTVPANAMADAGSDINYCPGDGAVALAASGTGSSFAWTATGYNNNPYGSPATPSAGEQTTMLGYLNITSGLSVNFEQTTNAPGKYVYMLTATDGACSVSDEVTIIVPDFSYSNLAGLSTAVCEGESVQLGITSPPSQLTYSWRALNPTSQAASIDNPSSSNPIVNPTETTTYELTYTDAVTACSETKTVTVTVTPKPVIADVDMAVQCLADISTIDLTAQIPDYGTYFSPVWYQYSVPGIIESMPTAASPTQTTNYFLVAENEFGCPDTAMVTVNIEDSQTPNIAPTIFVDCNIGTIDLADYQGNPSDPAFTLEWHSANDATAGSLMGNTIVGAGTYYLFERTGNDCVSTGDVLEVNAASCPYSEIIIGNIVWLDENGDGVQDAGEPGIAGVEVELKDGVGNVVATTTTDANGGYLFTDLDADTYTVTVLSGLPTGLVPIYDEDSGTTSPDQTSSVTVANGDEHLSADFAYNFTPAADTDNPSMAATGALGDRIWNDADGDGVQDPGESGIAGLTVTLYNDDDGDGVYDNVIGTATTDATGNYIFDGLAPDAYVVEVDDTTLPAVFGTTPTGDPDGDNTNTAEPVVIAPGDVLLTQDFGYQPTTSYTIGDLVFVDPDGDGIQDSGEPGIAGVTVALEDASGNVIATTTTDANGNYTFPGLQDGTYNVVITDTDNVLGELSPISDPDAGLDEESAVTIAGADDLEQDFGYAPAGHMSTDGMIGDLVYIDTDGDGAATAGEGAEGVKVQLFEKVPSTINVVQNPDFSTGDLTNWTSGGTGTTGVNGSNEAMFSVNDGQNASISQLITGLEENTSYSVSVVLLLENADAILSASGESISTSVNGTLTLNFTTGAGEISVTLLLDIAKNTNAGNVKISTADNFELQVPVYNNTFVEETYTDENGNYYFGGLDPALTYVVDVDETTLPGGDVYTNMDDPDGGTTGQSTVDLSATGPIDLDQDLGYEATAPVMISGTVWEDSNADGTLDGTETDLFEDVTLVLTDADGNIVATTTTDGSGDYTFENLPADSYTVAVEDVDDILLGHWHSQASTTVVNASAGSVSDVDFGYYIEGASIGNYVWSDADEDGIQDAGEAGIASVLVTLEIDYNGDGTAEITMVDTTDATGHYSFDNLLLDEDYPASGTVVYTVSATAPTGYTPTTIDVNSNGNDLEDSDDPAGVVSTLTQGSSNTTVNADPTLESPEASFDFGFVGTNTTDSEDDFTNTPFDTPVFGDASTNDEDDEGDIQTYTLDDTNGGMDPADGTVTINPDGTYMFDPASGFTGETSFDYVACDDGTPVACDTSTVYIEVFPAVNPEEVIVIANPDANTLEEGQTGTGDVMGNDLDPDAIDPSVVTPLSGVTVSGVDEDGNPVADAGTLTLNPDGTYTFVPTGSFTGEVTQEYVICDAAFPALACDTTTLVITVIPDEGNSTFANDDAAVTDVGVTVGGDLSTNDTDTEADEQNISSFMVDTDGDGVADAPGSVGTATTVGGTDDTGQPVTNAGSLTLLADGTYEFVPAPDFIGNVTIPYIACDTITPTPACDEATLVITVLDVQRDYGDAPAAYSAAWHRAMTDTNVPVDGVLDGATDVWLGSNTGFESAQQSSSDATGDSFDDAITFGSGAGQFPLIAEPNTAYNVDIVLNGNATGDQVYYGMWIDWDADGSYDDFYSGSGITNSPVTVTAAVTTPGGAGSETVNVRLRADDDPLVEADSTGGKTNGEVEDYQALVVLPVELISFEGKASNCDVQLDWTSASEENFSHYEVERSEDGNTFQMIDRLSGSEWSTISTDYQFDDRTVGKTNYYRLKMVDLDGSYKYSKVIFVRTNCEVKDVLIYPNPILKDNGILNISFYSNKEELEIEITDILGRVLKRVSLSGELNNRNNTFIDVSDLPSGTYLMQVKGSENSTKFIIQE